MANRKNDETKILDRRQQAVQLRKDGQSYRQIADSLGVSKGTAFSDVQAVHEEWVQANLKNIDALKRMELARLQLIEREAWAAWERSKLDSEQSRTSYDATGAVTRTDHATRTQCGDPRLLDVVLKCCDQRRKLLGLDARVSIDPWADKSFPRPGEADILSALRERLDNSAK